MNKYEVGFSKYYNEIFNDKWLFKKIEAESEQDAISKIIEDNTKGNYKVNYILHCTKLN